MKITIAAVGRLKNSPEKTLIEKYCQRLAWPVTFREIDIKQTSPAKRQNMEGEKLLASIPKKSKIIALDEKGKQFSSREFSAIMSGWQQDGISDISFLIGGADGHSDDVKKSADLKLSFGKMTLPHILARVVLVEQLYRCWSILQGHPYHRE